MVKTAAIMANRYDPFICPMTALAIYLSCKCFDPDANMVFSDDTKSTRYSDALAAFLKRDDVKQSIKQFAKLLLVVRTLRGKVLQMRVHRVALLQEF